jgi:dolichyl-phosphate-mannose-protein mannosyltransferase
MYSGISLSRMRQRAFAVFAALAIAIAVLRVITTYSSTSQAFDEPCHIAAGIELLDKHSYILDPVHPPLARLVIALPMYLSGMRFPSLSDEELAKPDYNVVGNHILYDNGRYRRNLVLARLPILMFLAGCSLLVFLWSFRVFGGGAAIASAILFTTTPIVLALSSVAYTDMVAATTQFAALWAFTSWLERPSSRCGLILGATCGLAVMAKLTSILFLPAAAIAIILSRAWASAEPIQILVPARWKELGLAAAIATLVLWSGYGFSVEHVREGMGLTQTPSFQHFPGFIAKFARALVLKNPRIPAPAFWKGLSDAWILNQTAPPAYLLEHVRSGGWWYFFLVGMAVKTPIPTLLLCGAGVVSILTGARRKSWVAPALLASTLSILLIATTVKYNAGMRHVLVLFPLFAMLGGAGAKFLWNAARARRFAQVVMLILLGWQAYETVRAQPDFIAYFNELAGDDPSRVLVAGCDLDCGQDIFRLARDLKARNVTSFNLAVWSSAEMGQMGLPKFGVLQPFQPVNGWVAVSARSVRFGDVLHTTYPLGSLSWLEKYTPVTTVGRTISLYYIPPGSESSRNISGNGPGIHRR